jgi:histone deacetylase complex regulatory component SIN3
VKKNEEARDKKMKQPRATACRWRRVRTSSSSSEDAEYGHHVEPQAPSRVLKRAVNYLEQVKRRFLDRPKTYRSFLDIMHSFKDQRVDIHGLVLQVHQLFEDHPDLLLGFDTFLPIDHSDPSSPYATTRPFSSQVFTTSSSSQPDVTVTV